MLRLRYIHTRYPHWCARSGFPRLVHHLDPREFRSVLYGAADSDADLPAWLAPLAPWLRRRVAAGGMPWYKLSDLVAELHALPGAATGRYDVVHFLDGEHTGQYLPRWLRMLPWPRPRLVASFHQPHTLQSQLVNPRLVRLFDHVTVLSPAQIPYFESFMPRARIHLIPHGVDTEFFHPGAPRERAPDAPLRCITVGHWLRDWRALGELARSFADGRVHFDLVTGGETGLEGLAHVTHHRGISDEELARRYREADVLLLPLTECTANNALLEGMASGLPVLTTELAGARFHLGGRGALFVPPGDTRGYVHALHALAADPHKRAELGAQARLRALELSWPRVARQFADFYHAITGGPRPAPRRRTGALMP